MVLFIGIIAYLVTLVIAFVVQRRVLTSHRKARASWRIQLATVFVVAGILIFTFARAIPNLVELAVVTWTLLAISYIPYFYQWTQVRKQLINRRYRVTAHKTSPK